MFRLGCSFLLACSWPYYGDGAELTANNNTSAHGEVFTLVGDARPMCAIVVAKQPTLAARLASLELQSHILKITGAELPILTDDQPTTRPRILVGESAATRTLGIVGADFKPQEYLVGFRPQTILLIGRDWQDTDANRREFGWPMSADTLATSRESIDYWKAVGYPARSSGVVELPGIYDNQGTCYAVYDFLERYCGVRWYGPAETGLAVPSKSTISVHGADLRRSPALKYRDGILNCNWPFMRGQWGPVTPPELKLFWRRIRLGGEKWSCNHTFYPRTIEKVFTNPEYQAQGKGYGSQLCYTNPKLIQQVAQMARDYFDGKSDAPPGWKALGDYFGVVPDDNMNFCDCDQCHALLDSGKDRVTGQFSSGTVSNYFFSFVNAVAREVHKTHPDKFIATLAYWNWALPPRGFDIEPNVSVAPCLYTCIYPIHPAIRENELNLYHAWLKEAKAPVFLWNYYHHPMEIGLIEKWKCFPNIMAHESAKNMRMFIQDGVRGIFVCGEQDMLETYVIAKIWDDPASDVDAIMHEFFERYFGSAGEPMETFYRRIEEIVGDPKNYPPEFRKKNAIDWKNVAWTHLGTAERMEQLGALMAEGEKLARTDLEKRRVTLWSDALWKWMVAARTEFLATGDGAK